MRKNKYGNDIKPIGNKKKGGNKNEVIIPQQKNFSMYVKCFYNLSISKECILLSEALNI